MSVTDAFLLVIMCLLIFDGFIWVAVLGNLSRILEVLNKGKEE